jgi:NADH-quinone oxidoreductase subunit E
MIEPLENGNLTREDRQLLDQLILEHAGKPGMLLSVLEKIQEKQPQKYLPIECLEHVAERTGIPAAQVFSVATFYSLFNLRPQGRHTVCICRGTACHTRGSQRLLESVRLQLGPLQGEEDDEGSADKISSTTTDGEFTIRTVACFGQCALAPVVEVDHQIRSHVNERALSREIETLRPGKH